MLIRSRAMRAMLAEVVYCGGLTTFAGFSHCKCLDILGFAFRVYSESQRKLGKVCIEYTSFWRVRFLVRKASWAKYEPAPTPHSALIAIIVSLSTNY